MLEFPKFKIKLPPQNKTRDICTLEQARYRFNWGHEPFLIVVEGRSISSFDDLVKLAKEDRFKCKEFLEVEIQLLLAGG